MFIQNTPWVDKESLSGKTGAVLAITFQIYTMCHGDHRNNTHQGHQPCMEGVLAKMNPKTGTISGKIPAVMLY